MKIRKLSDKEMPSHLRGKAEMYVTDNGMSVIVSEDDQFDGIKRIYMSVNHPKRAPKLKEIRAIRGAVLPKDKHFTLVPKAEDGCFLNPWIVYVAEVLSEEAALFARIPDDWK